MKDFWAILGFQISQIKEVFDFFVKKASSGFTSILLYMLIGALCTTWVSKAQFRGPIFVSQNSFKILFFGHFLKKGFTSVWFQLLIVTAFRGVKNMVFRGPILGLFWVPK